MLGAIVWQFANALRVVSTLSLIGSAVVEIAAATNKVVARIRIPAGSFNRVSIAFCTGRIESRHDNL